MHGVLEDLAHTRNDGPEKQQRDSRDRRAFHCGEI
jgi:hypothetical protein